MEKELREHVNALRNLIKNIDDQKMKELYSEIFTEITEDPTVKHSLRTQEMNDMVQDPFSNKERQLMDELSKKIQELRKVLGDRND